MLAILLFVAIAVYVVIVYLLAQKKICFTAPKEATAEFVMVGNTAERMIMAWKGRSADESFNIDDKERIGSFPHFLNPLNWMEPWGIYWYGLWPFYKIYRYDFIWTEEKVTDDGKIVPYTRRAIKGNEGQTSFVKINDTNYFLVANDVKTKGGVPLKIVQLVTIRIENPYKALFRGADWLERTGGAIHNMTVRYCGNATYEDVTESKKMELTILKKDVETKTVMSLEEFIMTMGDDDVDNQQGVDLLFAYGVRIVAAKIHTIEFADADAAKEFREATTQRYVAEQRGLGEEAEARGRAKAVEIAADAEKYRINAIYAPIAGDDLDKRMQIRQLEALEKSGSQGGNTIVLPDEILGIAKHFIKK